MNRRIAALVLTLALASCGGRGGLIGKRNAPDELLAGRQAPLVVPPDYNITPPKPGAPRPLAPDARTDALQALFPDTKPEPPKSPAEIALLQAAGADRPDSSARSTVGDPDTTVVNKGAFIRELIGSPPGGNKQVAQVSVSNGPGAGARR